MTLVARATVRILFPSSFNKSHGPKKEKSTAANANAATAAKALAPTFPHH
jgi:hypothetical protein